MLFKFNVVLSNSGYKGDVAYHDLNKPILFRDTLLNRKCCQIAVITAYKTVAYQNFNKQLLFHDTLLGLIWILVGLEKNH
jgi:hypothetical protein